MPGNGGADGIESSIPREQIHGEEPVADGDDVFWWGVDFTAWRSRSSIFI